MAETAQRGGSAPMARCAVRAAFKMESNSHVVELSFSPLNEGWDGAVRHPCQPQSRRNVL